MNPPQQREILPFLKFFPNDWLSDQGVRMCSLAARGLWIELLCLMWKSPRRGYLESSEGVALSETQLCRVIGESAERITALLAELDQAGVFSREAASGIIFSRRIVKDIAAFKEFSAWGQKGGNPALKAPLNGSLKGTLKPQKSEVRIQKTEDRERGSEPAPAKRRPTLAEWLKASNELHPEWPELDSTTAWHYYEARGWPGISRWRSCIGTCHGKWKRENPRGGTSENRAFSPTLRK